MSAACQAVTFSLGGCERTLAAACDIAATMSPSRDSPSLCLSPARRPLYSSFELPVEGASSATAKSPSHDSGSFCSSPPGRSSAGEEEPAAAEACGLVARLAAAERRLWSGASVSSGSVDSEGRDAALLGQIEDEEADARSSCDTPPCRSLKPFKLKLPADLVATEQYIESNHSGLSEKRLRRVQQALEAASSTSSQSESHRYQEQLWNMVQQSRNDMRALQASMNVNERRQEEEQIRLRGLLSQAQDRSWATEEVAAEAFATIGKMEQRKKVAKEGLFGRLEVEVDSRARKEDSHARAEDLLASRRAQIQVQVDSLWEELRLESERATERDRERVLVDAAQRSVHQLQLQELRRQVDEVQKATRQARDERDALSARARAVEEKATAVPELRGQIEEKVSELKAKLTDAAQIVPLADKFQAELDSLEVAQTREAERAKDKAELELQVTKISKEKQTLVGNLEHLEERQAPGKLGSIVEWIRAMGNHHGGDELEGSGEAYTLEAAKAHAAAVGAEAFTHSASLAHPPGTDGTFWFRSSVPDAAKAPQQRTADDGERSLWLRAEVSVDVAPSPSSLLTSGLLGATLAPERASIHAGLCAIAEDSWSDANSVAASCNVSSTGGGDVADLSDLVDEALDEAALARAASRVEEQSRMAREMQVQLSREVQERNKLAEELAAMKASKDTKLERLASEIESEQRRKNAKEEAIHDLGITLESTLEAKNQISRQRDLAAWRQSASDACDVQNHRASKLQDEIGASRAENDASLLQSEVLRECIGMAKFRIGLAKKRAADCQDAICSSEVQHGKVVARVVRNIADLQRRPGGERASDGGADAAKLEELRAKIAGVRGQTSELRRSSEAKADEFVRAKEQLLARGALQFERLRAEHEASVQKLRSEHEARMQSLYDGVYSASTKIPSEPSPSVLSMSCQ